MFDYETLSQNVVTNGPVIVNSAYFMFDWNRFTYYPYTFDELISDIKFDKMNISDQVKRFHFEISQDTMNFWKGLPPKVQLQLKPDPIDITIEEHLKNINEYLDKTNIYRWWSRANVFDPIILERLRRIKDDQASHEIDKKLSFWDVRDTRTFIDTKFDMKNTKNAFIPISDTDKWNELFEEHNAIHDVAADILRMQAIVRAENNLDEVI